MVHRTCSPPWTTGTVVCFVRTIPACVGEGRERKGSSLVIPKASVRAVLNGIVVVVVVVVVVAAWGS